MLMISRLVTAYYVDRRSAEPSQHVAFGTSGHRGSSLISDPNNRPCSGHKRLYVCTTTSSSARSWNRAAVPRASITHASSEPAFASALEVLAANDVEVMMECRRGVTPQLR